MESLKDHVTKYSHSLIYSVLHITYIANINKMQMTSIKAICEELKIAGTLQAITKGTWIGMDLASTEIVSS